MVAEGVTVGGRYRILECVGSGGMSTVYLATDLSLHRRWAVKQIRMTGGAEQREVRIRALTAEANLIKRLDHPAIPRIVDLIRDHHGVFVVMDFIEGQTLAEVLRRDGPQSEATVADWGIQLCDVLDYLHRLTPSVVFLDLKPSNIMVNVDGAIKLIDFGIARELNAAGQLSGINVDSLSGFGTPGYGAPEQFEDLAVVDSRADIHALGATLFQLLTGIRPRDADMTAIRRLKPEISEGMERIIATAVQSDPANRYQTCAECAYALAHYDEWNQAHRAALTRRWRGFVGAITVSAACLMLSGGTLIAAAQERNGDFTYWMMRAEQATEVTAAEEACDHAARIKPEDNAPYLHLIDRYAADGIFSVDEEYAYGTLLDEHVDVLRDHDVSWAELCYATGRLYWYYYRESDDAASRLTRLRAASRWMRDAADEEQFPQSDAASVYAGIADFNTHIVPLIDSGDDAGRYRPYLDMLEQLVAGVAGQSNEVMRLEVSRLTLDALRVYPRKFRMDGITKEAMMALCTQAEALAEATNTTSDIHDAAKAQALAAVPFATEAITNAFIDIKGESQ